jgi:hypothetical protein
MKQSMVYHTAKSRNIDVIPATRKARQKKVKTISYRCQSFMSFWVAVMSTVPTFSTFSILTLFPQTGQTSLSSGIGLLQELQTRTLILYLSPSLLKLPMA